MAKAILVPAKASALCQADGAQPALEWAVGGQCFESKVSSSYDVGWMRPPGCSCPPAFLTPPCCWTRYSSGNLWHAKCTGAERGAGLAPSLTLFRIFRNMNCHGYQSLGSSLATFALDVRLTKLFPHSPGGSCSCSGAIRQREPSLHLQPLPPVGQEPSLGAWHQCGKGTQPQEPGTAVGRQQHDQGTGCSPALILLRFPRSQLFCPCHVVALHPLMSCRNSPAFIFPNAGCRQKCL